MKVKKDKKCQQMRSIDELEKYMREHRSEDMLTVKDLIKYLKKQNPDACILVYEQNSGAWIEQSKDLSRTMNTVCELKEKEREWLESWYKNDPEEKRKRKIKAYLKETFRYAKDDDICISF